MHVVIQDVAAGKMWISSYNPADLWSNDNPYGLTFQEIEGTGNIVFEGTDEECKKYIENSEKETEVYAVFFNNAANDGFVSKENCNTGNWKSSKYAYYSYIDEFKNEKKANEFLEKLLLA